MAPLPPRRLSSTKYLKFSRHLGLGIFIFLSCLLPLAHSVNDVHLPNKTTIAFHWGDVNGNATLLTQGGYPSRGEHVDDLNRRNQSALLNDAVLNQARLWYEGAARRDAAGSGFYFSTNLFDSRAFGNDLMIVEITSAGPEGATVSQMRGHEIRDLANQYLDAGIKGTATPATALPLMTQYNGNWHVISRLPNASDASAVTVHFRPPAPADVRMVYEQLVRGQSTNQLLPFSAQIARELLKKNTQANSSPITRSSDIFMRRLIFDEAYPDLVHLTIPEGGLSDIQIRNYMDIFSAYEHFLPAGDSRLTQMAERSASPLLNLNRDLNTDELNFVLKAVPHLSQSLQQNVAQNLIGSFRKHIATSFSKTLNAYSLLSSGMDTKTRELWSAMFRDAAKEKGFTFEFSPGIMVHLEALVGRAKAQQLFFLSFRLQLESNGPNYFMPWIKDHHYMGDSVPELSSFVERGDISFAARFIAKGIASSFGIGNFLVPLLRYVYQGKNRARIDFWRPALQVGLMKTDFRKFLSHLPLTELLDQGVSVPEYVQMVRQIGTDLPALSDVLINDLTAARQLRTEDIPIAELVHHLKLNQSDADIRRSLEAGPGATGSWSRIQLDAIPLNDYIPGTLRALRNIPNSGEYSEISRTFTLVDPLYVSEDLRVMQASEPYRRFNEKFISGNVQQTQPTWENHALGWERLARYIWKRNSIDANQEDVAINLKHIGVLQFAEAMGDVRAHLLLNNVDGTKNHTLVGRLMTSLPEFDDWDRTKYKTQFTREQFQNYGGTNNREEIEKFFNIAQTPSGYELTFRTADQLSNSFPDLQSYRDFIKGHERNVGVDSQAIMWVVLKNVYQHTDPIDRAAAILHYCGKLHPFENGNGRLARMWASMELVQAGHPLPVGLPTNDFLMTEEHLKLEVKRSLRLGHYWQKMLKKAHSEGIATRDFFQTRFRGSALEGLMHIDPASPAELRQFVSFLERHDSPPDFGKTLMQDVERSIITLRRIHGSLAKMSEVDRQDAMVNVWREFQKVHAAELQNAGLYAATPAQAAAATGIASTAAHACIANALKNTSQGPGK